MALEVANINTFYGTSHILHGVSLAVGDNAIVSVLGRNGAGKTTLLRSIVGLNPPREGEIRFNGNDVTHLKTHERARLGVGYVPQGREIIADLTVSENLTLAMLGIGANAANVPAFVYDFFPALVPLKDRKGSVLSGGQQQQLSIARALAQEPKLLVLDEPTEGLQPSVVQEIEQVIKRINDEQRCSVLIVEQSIAFVRAVTQSFAIMENGQIAGEGDVEDLTDELANKHLSV